MRGLRGPSRRRRFREYDPLDAEKRRRPRDRAEVVRVADTIEHQHGRPRLRPSADVLRRRRAQRRHLHDRHNAAVMNRARDFLQLHRRDAAVNFFGCREYLAHGADFSARRFVKKESQNRSGVALKPRLHRREAADFEFFPRRRPARARLTFRHRRCGGQRSGPAHKIRQRSRLSRGPALRFGTLIMGHVRRLTRARG